jgi:lipopolysaccharide transport system ATP-binding protein
MSDIAIRVEKLSKQFKIGVGKVQHDTLRDQIAGGISSIIRSRRSLSGIRMETFSALTDVSFEVKKGEVVGIIGRNGAGKSTLLKILSRITEPTSGFADIHGRVASLLEVGTGFHPELSGRENIYLNGAILGMKRVEIARKFDDIVDFAEVGQFIDTPVKHYSSGMYVRLAFAVAAHLEPEILLIDEVLAVGDTAFQKKCLGKMGDVARDGRTILFVSHNMAAVASLCSGAHMLAQGRRVCSGNTSDVIAAYLSSFQLSSRATVLDRRDRKGNGKVTFTDVEFLSETGTPVEVIQSGQDVVFSVGYKSSETNLRNVEVSVELVAQSGQCMLIMNSEMVGVTFDLIPSTGRFNCRIDRFPLSPGQYHLTLFCRINGSVADWVQHAALVIVEGGDFYGTGRLPPSSHGGFLVQQGWNVEDRTNVAVNGEVSCRP